VHGFDAEVYEGETGRVVSLTWTFLLSADVAGNPFLIKETIIGMRTLESELRL